MKHTFRGAFSRDFNTHYIATREEQPRRALRGYAHVHLWIVNDIISSQKRNRIMENRRVLIENIRTMRNKQKNFLIVAPRQLISPFALILIKFLFELY
jgi:hypothetical protein